MAKTLTLMPEVRGLNPGADPPKFGAQTPPYPASRLQRCIKGPSPSKGAMWDDVCRRPSTGMMKKEWQTSALLKCFGKSLTNFCPKLGFSHSQNDSKKALFPIATPISLMPISVLHVVDGLLGTQV